MTTQQFDIAKALATRIGLFGLALLLVLLPVASYANTAPGQLNTGLIAHLDAQTVLHDNGLRLGLKTEQAGQVSSDLDPPDWQALVPPRLSSVHCQNSLSSLTELCSAKATVNVFLRPYSRAPPRS